MNFPSVWISWIKIYLNSASFSFLINGHPTSWISSSRGSEARRPYLSLSFYLAFPKSYKFFEFFALRNGMIPGFNNNLRSDFNHLMYDDDLILISHATRKSASYIKLCLSIYGQMTGNFSNGLKFEVFFPTWFNKRLVRSICSILSFGASSFPLTYLGMLIFPKKLVVSHFNSMMERIDRAISNWNWFNISSAC